MTRIRALIADDEATARRGLRTLLAYDDEIEVVAESATGPETLEALRSHRPDLVLLDVQMPELDGFDVLAQLDPEEVPIVVFVTAFDEYTLRAFDAQAIDYLLKPFSDERFSQALERAKQQARQNSTAALRERLQALLADRAGGSDPPAPYLRRLAVGPRDDVRFVEVAKILWIEADAYRVRVHCAGASFSLRGHLGSFERRLDPAEFFRVSRSAIVRLPCVRALRTHFHNQAMAVLLDGTELPVSRSRRAELLSRLEHTRPT